jgi:hypothetical protein
MVSPLEDAMKRRHDHGFDDTAEFAFGSRTHRDQAGDLTHDDDVRYRTSYEASPHRLADRTYEDVRPAYRLGHIAAGHPDHQGKSFELVEHEVQRGWSGDLSGRYGSWETVRSFARDAYERRLASVTERESANRKLNSEENLSDNLPRLEDQ